MSMSFKNFYLISHLGENNSGFYLIMLRNILPERVKDRHHTVCIIKL